MQKPVYCLPEPSLSPTEEPPEVAEGNEENGTNEAALWAMNVGGPSSKLHGGVTQNNRGAASTNIPA